MRAGPEDGRWYAYCVSFCSVGAAFRKEVSRQKMATYRRVAALPPKIGVALDEARAPLYVLRWIAWGKSTGTVPSRFDDVTRFHALLKAWPNPCTLSPECALGDLVTKIADGFPGRG